VGLTKNKKKGTKTLNKTGQDSGKPYGKLKEGNKRAVLDHCWVGEVSTKKKTLHIKKNHLKLQAKRANKK